MKVKAHKKMHLIFTSGQSMIIEKDEVVDTSEYCAMEIVARGGTLLSDNDEPLGPTAEEVAAARVERAAQIEVAVQTVINEGDSKDFGLDGAPLARGLEKHTGFPVSTPEAEAAFEAVKLGDE